MRRTWKAGAEGTESGYTYISILMVLAVMAISAQATFIPAQSARIQSAEAELIFRGRSYRDAIESFWLAGDGSPRLPSSLDELLTDPRADGVRHIRKLYLDPISEAPWTLIYGNEGGISGVSSASTEQPRKSGFFPADLEHFEGATNYTEWTFIFEQN